MTSRTRRPGNLSGAQARVIVTIFLTLTTMLLLAPGSMGLSSGFANATASRMAAAGLSRLSSNATVLPLAGYDAAEVTRAALRAAGVLVHDFAPPDVAWGAGHRGVDLAAAEGTPVRSPRAGVVTFSGVVVDRPLVVITHADGLRSTLEPVLGQVQVGTAVTAGETVGVLDAGARSHCAPDACLHWGVRRGESYLDPFSLLEVPTIILLPTG